MNLHFKKYTLPINSMCLEETPHYERYLESVNSVLSARDILMQICIGKENARYSLLIITAPELLQGDEVLASTLSALGETLKTFPNMENLRKAIEGVLLHGLVSYF